jgi:hypothetical protein
MFHIRINGTTLRAFLRFNKTSTGNTSRLGVAFIAVLLFWQARASAQGLASKYLDDSGIENDPTVLFSEDFEDADLKKWEEKKGPVALEAKDPHSGKKCVSIPMHRGKDDGGHLVKWFLPGADTVYARFYVKFSEDYVYCHHFVHLLAGPPNDRWRPFGKAGKKPDGTYFTVGMEPWFAWGKNPPPGEVNLYTYWPDMLPDPKMPKFFWGNGFFPPGPGKGTAGGEKRLIPPLGKWQCWEFMIQCNSAPDKADGKQAMWIDGKLAGEFTGFRWRTDPKTKIFAFWLLHYGYDSGDPTKQYWKDQQTVWFDDIVVAKEYVGPMKSKAEGDNHDRN